MNESINKELVSHIIDMIDEGVLTNDNRDEWHYLCFNKDYYLIGYFECFEWLKEHNVSETEAIAYCQEYEKDNFGDCKTYHNSEEIVNMLSYIVGEEIFNNIRYSESVEDLKNDLLDSKILYSLKNQVRR